MKQKILQKQNDTLTQNGAMTYRSTQSDVLDLFALGGSYRDASTQIKIEKFIINALLEDKVLALKVIFYLSDVRQGQGNRDLFRNALRVLIQREPKLTQKLLPYIAEYGRWDYLYWFIHTPFQNDALALFKQEMDTALSTGKPSLVFKWLASEVASSPLTRRNAQLTRQYLGLSSRDYRKRLSLGRLTLGSALVERKMSAGEWNTIQYEHVSSLALSRYTKTFTAHSPSMFSIYLHEVANGTKKINASVLYPYNILHQYCIGHSTELEAMSLLAQWSALPNYVEGDIRTLTVLDNSRSMMGTPIEVAASLSIYLSERLTGAFKDSVISFSNEARFFDLSGFSTVFEKYEYIINNCIVENTNLYSVFQLILDTAIQYQVPAHEMPNRIVILSDMEFDRAGSTDITQLGAIFKAYKMRGYEVPLLVFWNVNVLTKQVPATKNEEGVILVSGYSPSILKSILSANITLPPYELMLNVLNTPRYAFIDQLMEELKTSISSETLRSS